MLIHSSEWLFTKWWSGVFLPWFCLPVLPSILTERMSTNLNHWVDYVSFSLYDAFVSFFANWTAILQLLYPKLSSCFVVSFISCAILIQINPGSFSSLWNLTYLLPILNDHKNLMFLSSLYLIHKIA